MNQRDDQRPSGDGFKLGLIMGDSLRLAIVGYQFPEAEDLLRKYSWYLVEGDATVGGSGWGFRWQALTCDKAPAIAEWLRAVAKWAVSETDPEAPKAPWLIEPNVQFPAVRREDDLVVLTVELDLEFLPPDRRRGRVGAGNPVVLELRATPDELIQAATDFDATIAQWPGAPSESERS